VASKTTYEIANIYKGRVFHIVGAATAKLREPTCTGTMSISGAQTLSDEGHL